MQAALICGVGIKWGVLEAVKLSIDASIGLLTENLLAYCSFDVALFLFPRIAPQFLNYAMVHCGLFGARAFGLLRDIVGFPGLETLSSKLEFSDALFGACGTDDLELLKLLLLENVEFDLTSSRTHEFRCSILTQAAREGHSVILRFIIDHQSKSWSQGDANLALIACALADDTEYASRLLDMGAKPICRVKQLNKFHCDNVSALFVACARANVAMVRLLLAKGAELICPPLYDFEEITAGTRFSLPSPI